MRYTKFKIILTVVLIAITGLTGNDAVSGPRTKLGTMAAPELLIPLGSIGTSLQGSNLSSVTGIDAMYWNPAGLAGINSKTGEALFSYMTYIADMKMQYVAGAIKVGNLGIIGASLRNLSFGEPILVTTEYEPEGTGQQITPIYLTANLSFARAMTDKVYFGTNFKLITEKIADVSAMGFAFDFGLQYVAGKSGIRFGIALKNLGPSMKFTGSGLDRQYTENGIQTIRRVNLQEFELPTSLEIGASYTATFAKTNFVTLSSTFQNNGFTSDEYRFGLEYNYNNYVFIRGAYTYYPDKESADERLWGPSFGAGVKYPFGSLTLGFDYAYRIINKTGEGFNTHNQFFTLFVGF
jgi:hypothetical protein